MIQPIMKDEFFLAQKSVSAVNCEEDIQVARDLLETLKAHKEHGRQHDWGFQADHCL